MRFNNTSGFLSVNEMWFVMMSLLSVSLFRWGVLIIGYSRISTFDEETTRPDLWPLKYWEIFFRISQMSFSSDYSINIKFSVGDTKIPRKVFSLTKFPFNNYRVHGQIESNSTRDSSSVHRILLIKSIFGSKFGD